MNILIIGGTRFIGPYVVRHLVDAGHEATVFHRGQTEADLPPVVNHLYGERRDLPAFQHEFKELAPQVVLDMIAFTEQDAADLMSTFKRLAERVVVISSADVYRAYGCVLRMQSGPPDPIPLDERAPLREALYPHRTSEMKPDDFGYAYEKIFVEQVVMSEPELPGTTLRLPAVYGPGDPQHRLFNYLKRMDDRRPAILIAEQEGRWQWTRGYVENVAAAIALAVTDEQSAGRIYNVGEEDALAEAEWACAIGRAADWDGEIINAARDLLPEGMATDLAWEHHLAVDTSRLREELGYSEHVTRDEALKRAIDWERAHPPDNIDPKQFDYAAEDAVLERLKQAR